MVRNGIANFALNSLGERYFIYFKGFLKLQDSCIVAKWERIARMNEFLNTVQKIPNFTKKTMERINQMSKYIPLISIILIFLSFVNLHFFYSEFGIAIYDFLDTGELLLLFLPNILASLLIGTVIFISLLFTQKIKIKENNQEKRYRRKPIKYYFGLLRFRKLRRFGISKTIAILGRILSAPFVLWGIMIFLLIMGKESGHIENCPNSFMSDPVLQIYFLTCLFFCYQIAELPLSENILNISIIITIFFFFLLMMGQRSSCKAENYRNGNSLRKIEFTYEDSKVASSNNLVYLGGTKQYIFMFNLENEKSYVYEKSNVKNLVFWVGKSD